MNREDKESIDRVKDEFDAIAQIVEGGLQALPNTKRINYYTVVYNAATRRTLEDYTDNHYASHEALYVDYHEMLTRYMLTRFPPANPQWSEMELYERIVKLWKNYKIVQKWMLFTFGYLSRFYVGNCGKLPLDQVALTIFYNQMFHHHAGLVKKVIIDLLHRERRSEAVDRDLIRLGIEMFSMMTDGTRNVYHTQFLEPLFATTVQFYEKEAAGWLATDSATDYLLKVEQRLAEERLRCQSYFSTDAEQAILQKIEIVLLDSRQAKDLLLRSPNGFASVLERRDLETARRFYHLFSRVSPGLDMLAAVLKDRILLEGTERAKLYGGSDKEINCKECTMEIVRLQEQYMHLLQHALGSHPGMMRAMKEGFEKVLSNGIVATDGNGSTVTISFSELLANYCDLLLRQQEKYSEDQVESVFDSIVTILGYVPDKDTFQMHARELLSKRLLAPIVKSTDQQERALLMRLRQRCGAHFTAQFEGMMNDKASSVDISNRFLAYAQGESFSIPMEFSAMVLKIGIWPKFPSEDSVIVPPEMSSILALFGEFYKRELSQRLLKWSHSNSSVTLSAKFDKGSKEFQLTAFQSWVLLLFNNRTAYSAEEMMRALGLDFDEIRRILPSFAKTRVLLRKSEQPTLGQGDIFTLNTDFTSPHRKMQIPLAVPRISAANSARAQQFMEEDRKPAIDACIVRIMKSRKQISHQDLLAECHQQLSSRFCPEPRQIKLRIEDLIKRDYIERVPDSTMYRYLS
jgi:hypothetical protein